MVASSSFRVFKKCVREWARRKDIFIHYVWVLELTKRGRPHYHVLFWLPKGVSMPKADKQGLVETWHDSFRVGALTSWLSL